MSIETELAAQMAEMQRALPAGKTDRVARLRAAERDLAPRHPEPRMQQAKKTKRDPRCVWAEMSVR